MEEEKIFTSIDGKVVEATDEAILPELADEPLPDNATRDVSAALGVAAAICSTVEEDERTACWGAIEKLEGENASTEDAVDVIANILEVHGPAGAKEVKKSMDEILEAAREKAEPALRAKGALEYGEKLW